MWFPVVPEGIIDPAEFRRSASEARSQCRTHAHATATHREHLWIRGALGLVSRLTNLDKLPVSRQLQTESAAAAWTFIWANLLESEAPHIYPPCTQKEPRWPLRLQQQSVRDAMSSSPEETRSRGGGSDRDLKMASSSNTSLDVGLAPPNQNRIRQVGVSSLQWVFHSAL